MRDLSGDDDGGRPEPVGPADDLARAVVARLSASGRTIAVAESLTGGALTDALVGVPGASTCLRGGVVAYATDLKQTLLDVPAALLAREGAVHPEVVRAMAAGVRRRLGADLGVATTGVAGPDAQGGRPVGEVHLAVCDAEGCVVRTLQVGPGAGRAGVRRAAVAAALDLVLRRIGPGDPPHG